MSSKRKSDGPVPAPIFQKKARTGASTNTLAQLKDMSHDDLAHYACDLQSQLSALPLPAPRMTEEDVDAKASQLKDICAKEIKKQMKWQPSCKKGSTKWSYTGLSPDEDVFFKMIGIEKGNKG